MTAERWKELLGELGHTSIVIERYEGQSCDALVALHARKSAESVIRFSSESPNSPVIIALTGTDLYPNLESSGVDQAILDQADRLIVLQRLGLLQLPRHLHDRTHVIVQSAQLPGPGPCAKELSHNSSFTVVVLAHLRQVKDPLLAARAVRLLPDSSRVKVIHLGAEIERDLGEQARLETATNPRYRWLGELPHDVAMRTLQRSQLLALTSVHEGGANALCEALALEVPVISSQIAGSIGLLGNDYPGYFAPGSDGELAELLWRVEQDEHGLFHKIRRRCIALKPTVSRDQEREQWRFLLESLPC